jgi:hypothetical protein
MSRLDRVMSKTRVLKYEIIKRFIEENTDDPSLKDLFIDLALHHAESDAKDEIREMVKSILTEIEQGL